VCLACLIFMINKAEDLRKCKISFLKNYFQLEIMNSLDGVTKMYIKDSC